jgi:hypothetical protein
MNLGEAIERTLAALADMPSGPPAEEILAVIQAAAGEEAIAAATTRHAAQESGMSRSERRVKIARASDAGGTSGKNTAYITVMSLEDLESLCTEYGHELIIQIGDDGRLSSIEVYDDYRE